MEREVTINDAPAHTRTHLLKTTQAIEHRTRTVIVTRGRYYAPGQPKDEKERPLYLLIRPTPAAGQVRGLGHGRHGH